MFEQIGCDMDRNIHSDFKKYSNDENLIDMKTEEEHNQNESTNDETDRDKFNQKKHLTKIYK